MPTSCCSSIRRQRSRLVVEGRGASAARATSRSVEGHARRITGGGAATFRGSRCARGWGGGGLRWARRRSARVSGASRERRSRDRGRRRRHQRRDGGRRRRRHRKRRRDSRRCALRCRDGHDGRRARSDAVFGGELQRPWARRGRPSLQRKRETDRADQAERCREDDDRATAPTTTRSRHHRASDLRARAVWFRQRDGQRARRALRRRRVVLRRVVIGARALAR